MVSIQKGKHKRNLCLNSNNTVHNSNNNKTELYMYVKNI